MAIRVHSGYHAGRTHIFFNLSSSCTVTNAGLPDLFFQKKPKEKWLAKLVKKAKHSIKNGQKNPNLHLSKPNLSHTLPPHN